jgi:branched-chain amino acid transport system substrate-binding protein
MGMSDVRAGAVATGLCLTLAMGLLAGCGADAPATPDTAPIRLGLLAPLTGLNAPSGKVMVNAARLAVDETNSAGGVLGRKVELVVHDDACDPGTAVAAATTLIGEDITVSVGGYCSSATVPTTKIFRSAGVPMIIPLSNSTDLTSPGYDNVFLLSGTVQAEGVYAVDRIAELGGRRLAVVHDGTSFPLTLADATVDAAKAAGSPVAVAAHLQLAQGASTYVRVADEVIASRADSVYFTGYYGEANQLVKDLRGRGYPGLIVVGDGATDGPLREGLTEAQLTKLYGTTLLVPEFMPEAAEWSERYRAAYGDAPPPATIEAYDAVILAVDAIRRAGTLDKGAIRKAIAGSEDVNLVSGPVSFAANGTREDPRFLLLRAKTDGFELVADSAK